MPIIFCDLCYQKKKDCPKCLGKGYIDLPTEQEAEEISKNLKETRKK